MMTERKFTEEDIDACWRYHKVYLLQILNGEYSAEAAREDLASLVGSRFDERIKPNAGVNEVKQDEQNP
jgi:hypothetical protein